jgi:hypothetical protein
MNVLNATAVIDEFPPLPAELEIDGPTDWTVTVEGSLALEPGRRVQVRVTADGQVWSGPARVDGWSGRYRDDNGRMDIVMQLAGVAPLDDGSAG